MGSDTEKEKFIKALLYGGNSEYWEDITNYEKLGIYLNRTNFYDTIKEKTFTEKLGVYYQHEIIEESNTPNTDKTKKRVITYIEN